MGFWDLFKAKERIDEAFNKKVADTVLYAALSAYGGGNSDIIHHTEVYQQAAQYTLRQKIARCNNDIEYINSLKNNLYYYANTAHRYNSLLRKLLTNNMSANEAMRAVDKIQEAARAEVKQSILNSDDRDAVVSNIEIVKALDMPLGNTVSTIRKLDRLENLYQRLSVENDTLIETFSILTINGRDQKIFSNRKSSINSNYFFDYYFSRLKGFIEICASEYPSVLGRAS